MVTNNKGKSLPSGSGTLRVDRVVSGHHVYHRFTENIFRDVSVAEWLTWLTSNCGLIGAIDSSPSNVLKLNL